MSSTKSPVLKLVEEIIAADPGVRFASIIDKNGDVVEGIMNSGKTNLKSQQEEEYFCKQVAKRRKIRKEFDASLGKVRYVQWSGKNLRRLYCILPIIQYTLRLNRRWVWLNVFIIPSTTSPFLSMIDAKRTPGSAAITPQVLALGIWCSTYTVLA